MTDVRVHVGGYADSDDEERAELASRLRTDLQAHDLEVSYPDAQPPPGAKGGAYEWAELAVTVAGSMQGMTAGVQGWLGRHKGATVSLEIDGDKLTLEDASPADQRRLLETFLARHAAG